MVIVIAGVSRKYDFYVPRGTIKHEYVLDAQ